MSNKFYKPKNERGELLISEVKTAELISTAETTINSRIDEVEESLDNTNKNLEDGLEDVKTELKDFVDEAKATINTEIEKIETAFAEKHSLVVRRFSVPSGVSSYDELDNVITPEWEAVANDEVARKKFAKELAETIFIAKSIPAVHDCGASCECEDAYEEFYCINAASITEGERPKFTRFGAVDSILASDKLPGSVVLRGTSIYDTEDWSIYESKSEFQDEYHPVAGYAVAPIALREFKNKDKELSDKIDGVKSDLIEEDSKIVARIEGLNDIVTAIRGELKGTEEEGQLSGSRIDRIEDLIGLSGCSKCGHDKCSVNPEEDGSILCRLTELKSDSETHWEQIDAIDTALGTQGEADEDDIVTVWGSILKNSTDIATHTANISGIDAHLASNDKKIEVVETNIADNVKAIAANAKNIDTNIEAIATNAKNITTNAEAIVAIETSLGHNIDVNDTTSAWTYILKNINDIKTNKFSISSIEHSLGVYPTSYENKNITAWGQITQNDSAIQSNKSQIDTINAEIESIKNNDIATINANIETNSVSIEGLENRVIPLETAASTNTSDIQSIKESINGLVEYREENTNKRIKAVEDSLGTNDVPETLGSVWHNINKLIKGLDERVSEDTSLNNAIIETKESVSELRGEFEENKEAVETDIIAAKEEAILTAEENATKYTDESISTSETKILTEAKDYTDETLKAVKAYTDEKQSEANSYALSLLVGQPSVAVIACGLAEGEVIQNGESTWANSTTIFASNFVDRLPYINSAKNVNFAVTSVRYTSDDPLITGEQITPEILYFGQTTNDATNGRSARITFNDYQRKPQSLLVTITYWEDDKVLHV